MNMLLSWYLWLVITCFGLQFCVLADLHHGRDSGSKKGSTALKFLQRFRAWLRLQAHEFVLDLGDRINDLDRENDLSLMQTIGAELRRIRIPRHHLLGNHDVEFLSVAENEEALDSFCRSHSRDYEGFHFIFWNAGAHLARGEGMLMEESSIEWLRSDLEKTDLPTVVCTHAPLVNGCMHGNYYFERTPQNAHYLPSESAKARAVIEESGKVILALSGHVHWFSHHAADNVHYISLPSATDSFMCPPSPLGAWASVRIEDEISIEVHGKQKIGIQLPIRELGSHWLPCLAE